MYVQPTSVMDPYLGAVLFVFTFLVHGITFFLLQNVASCFKDYISPLEGVMVTVLQTPTPPLPGLDKAKDPAGEEAGRHMPPAAVVAQARVPYLSARGSSTTAHYYALHETLDVSVFR